MEWVIVLNNYLAKSNPKETIIEHTEQLIENYNILRNIYPNLNLDWDILYLSCLYHDLGKMNKKFQDKIENIKRHKDEIPHGILSLAFINPRRLKEVGYSQERIKLLAQSIAYHHERDFNFDQETLANEIETLKKEAENFNYNRLDNIEVRKLSKKYFSMDRTYEDVDEDLFYSYIKIKGMLNRIDYAASGGITVERGNNFLVDNLNDNLLSQFRKENPAADWNKLQKYMIENREQNIIITAQTGMGKTEAGLLWIGNNKGFFTLPLKTAINAIYKRITKEIVVKDYDNKVGLLHSDVKREYLTKKDEVDLDEYYTKTRQLSLPLTVCTIDQIFDFVYRYRGFESKLSTLSYSKIVIDEVQMYAPDLLAYLVVGLSYIDKIGGKFAVLTATLPQLFVELLEEENVHFIKPEPFTNKMIRHSLKVKPDKLNSEFIETIYSSNKVLVICNTVKEAQRIYNELTANDDIKDKIHLFHSGFIRKDRKNKEEGILNFGDRDYEGDGIWVTTQVVEASLDIDFDILVTELSDLNGLFQRLGRCYRNRKWLGEGYNCYVFNGGDSKPSGVGNVIDEDIFYLSKNALLDIDGPITEDKKIQLINEIYTNEKLKNTDYYKKLVETIKYVKLIETYEKDKAEIKKIFRNIESKAVIPKPVYDYNENLIEEYISMLKERYTRDMSQLESANLKEKKLEARIKLDDFKLNIPLYRADKNLLYRIDIDKYEFLEILECDYDNEVGITYKTKKERDRKEIIDIEDKFF